MNKKTKFIAVICGLALTMVFSVSISNAVSVKSKNTSINNKSLNTPVVNMVDTIECEGTTICFTKGDMTVYGNYREY